MIGKLIKWNCVRELRLVNLCLSLPHKKPENLRDQKQKSFATVVSFENRNNLFENELVVCWYWIQ